MWAIATVQRSGTHVCTLRRRGLQHALLRVASLAHVDDFKIVEVRAPLVVAAGAATVVTPSHDVIRASHDGIRASVRGWLSRYLPARGSEGGGKLTYKTLLARPLAASAVA